MSTAGPSVGLGLTLALLLGVTASPFAQSGPGGYGPGPGRVGHHLMIPRGALEGPPAPAILRDSIGLSGDQLERYAQRYSNYMADTRPARDSLRTTARAMRADFESGDRSAARSRRDAIEQQANSLAKRDKEFEKVLKEGLSKDQQKRYDKWKKSREKADQERRHLRRSSAGNL
jgi:hypothetical protein